MNRFFKLLTNDGKEVLTQSVALTFPNHALLYYRLSKSITNKLTSFVAQFWLSLVSNSQGMHWMLPEKLWRKIIMEE